MTITTLIHLYELAKDEQISADKALQEARKEYERISSDFNENGDVKDPVSLEEAMSIKKACWERIRRIRTTLDDLEQHEFH